MTQWEDSPEAQRIFRAGWNAAIEAAVERAAQRWGVLDSTVIAISRLSAPVADGEISGDDDGHR